MQHAQPASMQIRGLQSQRRGAGGHHYSALPSASRAVLFPQRFHLSRQNSWQQLKTAHLLAKATQADTLPEGWTLSKPGNSQGFNQVVKCQATAQTVVTSTWSVTSNSELITWRERLTSLAEQSWSLPDAPSSSSDEATSRSPHIHPHLLPVTHGASARRGLMKPDMQDAHVVVSNWQALQGHDEDEGGVSFVSQRVPCSLTAVFDGHCGSRSARYSAIRLPQLLATNIPLWQALEGASRPEGLSVAAATAACGAVRRSFAQLEREILDEDRCKPPGEFDGTTALMGLQVGQHLIVANLGDSRAVLSRNGSAVRLSRDHTPDLPEERNRVEAVGGYVRQHKGVWRLVLPLGPGCGLKICAVSRALGDIDYKEPRPLISADPDVTHWPLVPYADEFVIYASDGVWVVLSDQDAVQCVDEALREARAVGCDRKQSATVAALALQMCALERGSKDDITAVIGLLDWQDGKVSA